MSFSTYLENKLLDYTFGSTAFTPSGDLWIALSTASINDDGEPTEPDVINSGYARVSGANDKDTWSTAAAGAIHNKIAFTFPEAVGNWGEVTYFAIMDQSGTGLGNMYGWGELTSPRTISAGDTPRFASGDLDITLD